MSYTANKNETKKLKKGGTKPNFTGDIRVWWQSVKGKKGDFYSYSSAFSAKDDDGFRNMFYRVRFTKDNDPCEYTDYLNEQEIKSFDITVNSSFFTFDEFENKAGNTIQQLVLVITDFDIKEV